MHEEDSRPDSPSGELQQIAAASGVAPEVVGKIIESLAAMEAEGGVNVTDYLTYGDLMLYSIQGLRETRSRYQQFDLTETVPPLFPSHVQVQTIGGCNASCVMCAMSSAAIRKAQRGLMSMELFTKIIDECASFEECQEVALYLQNEPLLDQTLALKVRLTKERSGGRLGTRIVTNGSLLDGARIDEFIEAGIDVISVSLNAFSAETYCRVMPGLDFAQTLNNVERLLDKASDRLMVILTFMVTTANEHEIQDAVEYWAGRDVMCGAYGIGTMAGTVPNFDSVRAKSSPERPHKECYLPLDNTAILCDGDILLCCTDWARQSISGNVGTRSIYDIWHSEPLSGLRRQAIFDRFEHPTCHKCPGQTRVPKNLMYEGGPGTKYKKFFGNATGKN